MRCFEFIDIIMSRLVGIGLPVMILSISEASTMNLSANDNMLSQIKGAFVFMTNSTQPLWCKVFSTSIGTGLQVIFSVGLLLECFFSP